MHLLEFPPIVWILIACVAVPLNYLLVRKVAALLPYWRYRLQLRRLAGDNERIARLMGQLVVYRANGALGVVMPIGNAARYLGFIRGWQPMLTVFFPPVSPDDVSTAIALKLPLADVRPAIEPETADFPWRFDTHF